jgi:hypothetical protein
MVKKPGNMYTGKPFFQWCKENGKRGERLANEFKDPDKLPTEVCKGSQYKALWKCRKCKHAWRAKVNNRTRSVRPSGCPQCVHHARPNKANNFLTWCGKNGERGVKLLKEYVDPEREPTEVTRGSQYMALWKCQKCKHAWRAIVNNRTRSVRPSGCPQCANHAPLSKTDNFLTWCGKNGERGAKLLKEYVDPERELTEVKRGSKYKALWKCRKCKYAWKARVDSRTSIARSTGCPQCNKGRIRGKRGRAD